jgi:glycosyltransferase involved in cell wall biosynthesis
MRKGPLSDWLQANGNRVKILPGLATFTAATSADTLARFPVAYTRARIDARNLHRLMRPLGITNVHTHWLPQQLIAGHLRRHYGYKSVWQINNNTSRKRLWGMGIRLNHALVRWGADLLLPASDYIANNWRDSGVQFKTIHNAAEPLYDGPSSPPTDVIRCLIAGRMESSKGHHLAIEAVISARKRGLAVELDIVGGPMENNSYADELKRRIQSSGESASIRILGFRKDLRKLHSTYNLGLQCRIDPEPCSLWVCETLVDGLPLIASANGGTPELVADGTTGLLFESGNVVDLTNKLVQLVSDKPRLAGMRQAAFDRGARLFTAEHFAKATLEAYAGLGTATFDSRAAIYRSNNQLQ